MALPQRGQLAPLEAQVVPQLEQVHTRQQALFAELAGGQFTLPPPNAVVEPFEPLLSEQTSSKAQEDCGNSGSEKNSSHTDSANSSQGGISQNP